MVGEQEEGAGSEEQERDTQMSHVNRGLSYMTFTLEEGTPLATDKLGYCKCGSDQKSISV